MCIRDSYECDLQGVVNNANYHHYLEHARHQLLKSIGLNFAALSRDGVNLVVTRVEIDYLWPLRSGDAPAPIGEHTVRGVAFDPTYRYDPARLPTFGQRDHGAPDIAAGPTNPVGAVWIALSAETYGIHGAPNPSQVSKTQSHGCIRLTNWDVIELGHAVRPGGGAWSVRGAPRAWGCGRVRSYRGRSPGRAGAAIRAPAPCAAWPSSTPGGRSSRPAAPREPATGRRWPSAGRPAPPSRDRALRMRPSSHLCGETVPLIAVRKGRFLRGFAYRFIELCSPALTEAVVRSALRPESEMESAY